MKKIRIIILLSFVVFASSCTQKGFCPTYASTSKMDGSHLERMKCLDQKGF